MMRIVVLLWLVLLWAGSVVAQVEIPQLRSPVTDLTASLTVDQRQQLEQKLLAFQRSKGAQLAVLIVPSTKPEEIEQYSIRVVEQWKLGRKQVDDGVLLLIAKQDRELRIEVAYGLEGALSDLVSKRIIDDIIVPHFRRGDIFAGIDAGIEAIIKVVSGEPLPEPQWSPAHGGDDPGQVIFPLIMIVAIGSILRVFLGAGFAASLCGIGAIVAASFFVPLLLALIAGVVVAFLVFVGAVGSGSRGGFSSSSGGSGSSYGGGGGSFGGGGASGRW